MRKSLIIWLKVILDMSSNGNRKGSGVAELSDRIVRALEDPRYDWRTIEGVANETSISPATVQEVLENLKQEVLRSSIPDESGRNLFTTRRHYRQTHGLGARFLAALSDKVA
jgi:hypothetical protein